LLEQRVDHPPSGARRLVRNQVPLSLEAGDGVLVSSRLAYPELLLRLPAPSSRAAMWSARSSQERRGATAGNLRRLARVCRGQRRALLATLTFGGLRLGEAQALRWRDVDLARGTIIVRAAKTDAGVLTVNLLPVLRDELGDYRARLDPASDALVFCTTTGRRLGATNIRRRVLDKAVKHANAQLAAEGFEPLPDGLTPHSLRRTFASLLFAIGETPPYVMGQMGHATPNLTLAIYARQMDRREGEPERLSTLLRARD
jgi:integrase